MNETVSRLEGVSKTFHTGGERVAAVRNANFSIMRGEMIGVVGPSGSGKTTLLGLIGMLEKPDEGKVFFQERDVTGLGAAEKRKLRLAKVGFVFQQMRLIPTLSAIENVQLPMALSGTSGPEQNRKAVEILAAVGLAGKGNRRPEKLSTGEQQRVAIARSVANNPALVLADEPTSQLDSSTGQAIIALLDSVRERFNAAIVITTHDPRISDMLGRSYRILDGTLTP